MTIRTRFAPSPTGRLHVGNIRTALHNFLLARQMGGKFWLRIDDTDAERSREAFTDAIRLDLGWLGLTPDGEERQSKRLAHYEAAFEQLRQTGRVYPAFESAQELEVKRKVQMSRGLAPLYDRAALDLSDEQRANEAGRRAVRRIGASSWTTPCRSRGMTAFAGRSISTRANCPIR